MLVNQVRSGAREFSELDDAIEFVSNDQFEQLEESEFLEMDHGRTLYADREARDPVEVTGVGDFGSLRSLPLLSVAGEAFLFGKLNYLRYQAERVRIAIVSGGDTRMESSDLGRLLSEAEAVRNHIAECNLRLVLSIARRFSSSETEFDEAASEGITIMLKAIDKFDFARGFRFSTYATNAVQRHLYRVSGQKQRRLQMEVGASMEHLGQIPSEVKTDTEPSVMISNARRMKTLVSRMDECLDDREQRIIEERFGIGNNGVVRTLRDVAQEVDLSKERVRQIQIVAVGKLRKFFGELQPDLLSA
jgi:RNA polymerase sigma factor (sigma-70 family)